MRITKQYIVEREQREYDELKYWEKKAEEYKSQGNMEKYSSAKNHAEWQAGRWSMINDLLNKVNN